jgi:hypothetical protein
MNNAFAMKLSAAAAVAELVIIIIEFVSQHQKKKLKQAALMPQSQARSWRRVHFLQVQKTVCG